MEVELQRWLKQEFSSLPSGSYGGVYRKLWSEKRLSFTGDGHKDPDIIDELSAKLVYAALKRSKQLLIVFPDKQPRRPALLFATSLIVKTLDRMKVSQTGGHVLYFGSSVGIRAHLSHTSVQNLTLDAVFPEAHAIGRDTSKKVTRYQKAVPSDEIVKLRLPQVLCVYSPADPVRIIQRNPSDWIAVDCGDGTVPPWLTPLVKHACAHGLPIVAWCQNLLSEWAVAFARAGGRIFCWPETTDVATTMTPVLLSESDTDDISEHLQEAQYALTRAARTAMGRLGQDAVQLGWTVLRTLEGLSVPLDLYEVEAKGFWGLRSITRSQKGFLRYIETVAPTYPTLSVDLEAAYAHMESVMDQLRIAEPPLWTALTELCVTDVPAGMARVLVFPSAARKQIFIFALLSRLNITEEDLRDLRVWVRSLKEFRQAVFAKETQNGSGARNDDLPRNLNLLPLLVGVPSPFIFPRLDAIFRHPEVEVLLYPYQCSILARRVALWKEALEVDLSEEVKILSYLGGSVQHSPLQSSSRQRIALQPVKHHKAGDIKRGTSGRVTTPTSWQALDPVEEVKWLLQADNEVDEDGLPTVVSDTKEISDEPPAGADDDTAWVEDAIAVRLTEGWYVVFSPDETVQVIVASPEGDKLQERYVRSLRIGDRILFIHGQRRQSLYDLIISRVHQNAAIEVHLALIRHWHDDFRQAYYRNWQGPQRGIEELLHALRARGSSLVSPQTLRSWLRGHTLCPDDAEDLHRLAEELNLTFVRQYYHRIHSAAQRLAGIHRGLAIRLNHWLRRRAFTDGEGKDDIIDPELGLAFRDFRDSLMVLRVEAAEKKHGPFFRSSLGQLERRGDDEQR